MSERTKDGLMPAFLGLVIVLFLGILIWVALGSRDADPVMLDEHGQPRSAVVR